jgi:hypothetical protein
LRLSAVLLVAVLLVGSTSLAIPAENNPAELAMIERYLKARNTQQDKLHGMQMEVEIQAKLPRLEKQGRLQALRSISKLGQITYKALGFTGDNTVKQEVISRYLSAEVANRDAVGSIAINLQNYKFRIKATVANGNQNITIFEINPRKKRIGLFKGELWVDTATGMPLKESGRWVKNPSVFLKKVEFVQDYEMIPDGFTVPKHLESRVETRLVGLAELDIAFSHFTRPDNDAARVAEKN